MLLIQPGVKLSACFNILGISGNFVCCTGKQPGRSRRKFQTENLICVTDCHIVQCAHQSRIFTCQILFNQ